MRLTDEQIADRFRQIEGHLKDAPLTVQSAVAEIKNELDEAKRQHVKVNLNSTREIEALIEAVIGDLLDAGNAMAREISAIENSPAAYHDVKPAFEAAQRWTKERVG